MSGKIPKRAKMKRKTINQNEKKQNIKGFPIICNIPRCKYTWTYKGHSRHHFCCPSCHSKNVLSEIQKNKVRKRILSEYAKILSSELQKDKIRRKNKGNYYYVYPNPKIKQKSK